MLRITQASSSAKSQYMYATPTFITEALCLVTCFEQLKVKVTILYSNSLVLLGCHYTLHINSIPMPTNGTDYSCYKKL